MKLKKGYKNTDIGVIPEDWEVKTLGEIGDIATGSTPPTKDRANYGSEFLFVSPADLGKSKWIENSEKKLSKKGFSISRKFPKNSILFTCIGSTIGKSGISEIELTSNQQINAVFPNESYNTEFAYYELQKIAEKIKTQAGEQAVPMVNKTSFAGFKIPLPSLPEQKAIASVLSDMDSLIEALEKKITKKRLIKKGAMQELLKPKEGWEKKRLGDFLQYEQPTNYIVESTEYNDNYNTPVLTAGKTFVLGFTNEEKGIFENYPVIIFDDFTTASKYVNFSFKVKSSAMKILKPKNEDVNLRFIYDLMQLIRFPLGDHKRHWIGEFQNLKITIPPTKEEQTEIATILSDMDSEIEHLEKQLAKQRQIKTGMMQELLTGKTRLI